MITVPSKHASYSIDTTPSNHIWLNKFSFDNGTCESMNVHIVTNCSDMHSISKHMHFVTFLISNHFSKAMKPEEQNDGNYRQSLQDLYASQELQFSFN